MKYATTIGVFLASIIIFTGCAATHETGLTTSAPELSAIKTEPFTTVFGLPQVGGYYRNLARIMFIDQNHNSVVDTLLLTISKAGIPGSSFTNVILQAFDVNEDGYIDMAYAKEDEGGKVKYKLIIPPKEMFHITKNTFPDLVKLYNLIPGNTGV